MLVLLWRASQTEGFRPAIDFVFGSHSDKLTAAGVLWWTLDSRPDEGTVLLKEKEVMILRLLSEHEGEPVDRETILDRVWGFGAYPTTRTVDMHVLKLRQKIEPDPENPRHIHTVHGVGYKFTP